VIDWRIAAGWAVALVIVLAGWALVTLAGLGLYRLVT
jgi:hypothetical protein